MSGSTDQREQGTAIIEFALVAVLFFGLVFAAMDFGYAFMVRTNMVHAAQEGLRQALLSSNDNPDARAATAVTEAQNRMKSITASVSSCGSPANAALNVCTDESSGAFAQCQALNGPNYGQCLTITVNYDYKDNSILGPLDLIPGWGRLAPSHITVSATQRMGP